ncbi:MAG: tyrosine recombinase XerC [Burkholderiaceae bacterium]
MVETSPPAPADTGVDVHADVDAYLQRLRVERGCSAHTIAAYRIELRALREAGPDRAWSDWTEHDVRRWVAQATRDGLAPRSIARRLSCWRGFFDWLGECHRVTTNPARGVRAPRPPRRLPKALPPDMAVRLVGFDSPAAGSVDDQEAEAALRDKAIVELMYSSGLRLSELIGLDHRYVEQGPYRSSGWIDLALADATVWGKGGKRRTVPIGSQALAALRAWLPVRERWLRALTPRRATMLDDADRAALFVAASGKRLAARAVQRLVKRLAQRQGIEADVHPHVLRHSFASHLLQSSGDLRAVQELLGHASIATTQVYTSLDFQRLAAVYDAAHPRARRRTPGGAGTPDDARRQVGAGTQVGKGMQTDAGAAGGVDDGPGRR